MPRRSTAGPVGDPPRLWIYVGVSMRDKDLLPVLRGEDFARRLDERWVNPYLLVGNGRRMKSAIIRRSPADAGFAWCLRARH